mmetsp:Transcript_45/g.47  ORF Transcript_45/g.47 Transcript_45/m.47 type:complete len:415 (-) Transcript_45:112-1356(-)
MEVINFDIKTIDKSNFECFQLPDESVYFGETAFVDAGNNVTLSLEEIPEEEQTNYKKIRHGFGIQLFGTTQENVLCKFEGYWRKNRKHGEGICVFPDNSTYQGHMADDVFDGYGKYLFANGDEYIGEWREGRMEGEGKFMTRNGGVLSGNFKNNYFLEGENNIMNPFLPVEVQKLDFERRQSTLMKRDQEEIRKAKEVHLFKTSTKQDLHRRIKETIEANRTPLVLASKGSLLKKSDLYSEFSIQGKQIREIDLRELYNQTRRSSTKPAALENLRSSVLTTLLNGDYLTLNIDDTSIRYDEVFDPDLREFYGQDTFPSLLWTPQEFASRGEAWNIMAQHDVTLKLNTSYQFIVWSKYRIDENNDDQGILEKFEQRFGRVLSLDHVNLVLCCGLSEEEAARDDQGEGGEQTPVGN